MNIKNKSSNMSTKSSFIAGMIVGVLVLLLINTVKDVYIDRVVPNGIIKDVSLSVSFIEGGHIVISDEKGKIIGSSPEAPINSKEIDPFKISFITVTQSEYDKEAKDLKTGLINIIIPIAMASSTTYEYHIIKVDNHVVACRKHRVQPLPHQDVGSC